MTTFQEVALTDEIMAKLIQLSQDWEDEKSCYGYRAYVIPARRSAGIGRKLFELASDEVRSEAEYMVLSTATKNWRAIFRFYLDELGMEFWSARLYKKIREDRG